MMMRSSAQNQTKSSHCGRRLRLPASLACIAFVASVCGCAALWGADFSDLQPLDDDQATHSGGAGGNGSSGGGPSQAGSGGAGSSGGGGSGGDVSGVLEVIVTDRLPVSEIAVDDTDVYFSIRNGNNTEKGIWRVKKTGGTPERWLPMSGVLDIALDATTVYFTQNHGLRKASKTGSSSSILHETLAPEKFINLTIADGYLYWVVISDTAGHGRVSRIGVGGIDYADDITKLLGNQPASVAVDQHIAYWTDRQGTGSVRSVPVAGGPVKTIVSNVKQPGAIAAKNKHLCYSYELHVATMPQGGKPVILPTIQWFSAAIDGSFCYGPAPEGLARVPLGKQNFAIVAAVDNIQALAFDDRYIYFTAKSDAGSVWRLGK